MSQFISLEKGIEMTTAYRQHRATLITGGSVPVNMLPICETFEKTQVAGLLNKADCQRLRIYLGLEEGAVKLILVAVNSNDEDMLATPGATVTTSTTEDNLLERGVRCPSDCPPPSSLNP